MKKRSDDLHQPNFIHSADFEYLCFNLARELMSYDEPIPEYPTRDNDLLESSLASPKASYGGQLLYPRLIDQASVLFYSMIKNHPFKNGNKRIAVMSLLVFLHLNKKWLKTKPLNFYNLAINIAKSDPKDKDSIIKVIKARIKKNLIGT